jgi:ribosome biogenesis SPOUT family RNA methylase Rps3
MTTDTAVRVTRMVTQEKSEQRPMCPQEVSVRGDLLTSLLSTVPLEQIHYVDYPELRINAHESTEMPFRYVKDQNELPIMPEASLVLSEVEETDAD